MLKELRLQNRLCNKGKGALRAWPHTAKLPTCKRQRPKNQQQRKAANVIQTGQTPSSVENWTWQHCPHESGFRVMKGYMSKGVMGSSSIVKESLWIQVMWDRAVLAWRYREAIEWNSENETWFCWRHQDIRDARVTRHLPARVADRECKKPKRNVCFRQQNWKGRASLTLWH